MSKKCENCTYFLKMKSLGETMALCTYFDHRIYPDSCAKSCKGFKRPKYKRKRNDSQ